MTFPNDAIGTFADYCNLHFLCKPRIIIGRILTNRPQNAGACRRISASSLVSCRLKIAMGGPTSFSIEVIGLFRRGRRPLQQPFLGTSALSKIGN